MEHTADGSSGGAAEYDGLGFVFAAEALVVYKMLDECIKNILSPEFPAKMFILCGVFSAVLSNEVIGGAID